MMGHPSYRTLLEVLRAPVVLDEHSGEDVRQWDQAEALGPYWCSFEPAAGGTELTTRQQTTIERWAVATDPIDVLTTDRVRVAGAVYEIVGDIGAWPGSPHDHREFTVSRVVSGT